MNFYTWTGHRLGGHAQALMLFANLAGLGAAGLAYGWPGLAVAVAASLALWLGPWPRLARACGRKLDAWLFEPAPAQVRYAHERAPRRPRRRGDAHLLPYDRLKNRYGEYAAAMLVFATGMGVIGLALAVWVLGTEWGINNPGSKAMATLVFGGLIAFALWRPDLRWCEPCCCCNCTDSWTDDRWESFTTSPMYADQPGNFYYSGDD